MKKSGRLFVALAAALTLAVNAVPTMAVTADTKTYTVTFRAGNDEISVFKADEITAANNMEVTDNYIRFTVERGETLAESFGMAANDASLYAYFVDVTEVNSDYVLKNISSWNNVASGETVTSKEIKKNTEYVLDYGKLVNPISYTIYYVDEVSREQIAMPTIAYGNIGEVISIAPRAWDNYTTDDATISFTLSADTAQNTITYYYVYSGAVGTVTETTTTVVDGATITQTQVNEIQQIVPAAGAAVLPAAAAGGADAGGVVDIPDDDTPLADGAVNIADEEVPLADGADNEDGNNAEEDDAVNIEEDDVPLADGAQSSDSVDIADEETPLADGAGAGWQSYAAPVIGGTAALAVVVIGVVVLVRRRKTSVLPESDDKKNE